MSEIKGIKPYPLLWLIVLVLIIPAAARAEGKQCPKVTDIVATTEDGKSVEVKSASIRLEDRITIKIGEGGSQKSCDLGPSSPQDSWLPGISNENAVALVPFLHGRPSKGIHTEAFDPRAHTITFHLRRTISEPPYLRALS